MYGFIRRCNFGVTLSLIVLTIVLCQISSRTDLSSSNTRPRASGGQESSYSEVLALGEPIDQVLPGGERHSYKITLNSGQYLRLLITRSGTQLSHDSVCARRPKAISVHLSSKWPNNRIRNCRGIRDLPIRTPLARKRSGTRPL